MEDPVRRYSVHEVSTLTYRPCNKDTQTILGLSLVHTYQYSAGCLHQKKWVIHQSMKMIRYDHFRYYYIWTPSLVPCNLFFIVVNIVLNIGRCEQGLRARLHWASASTWHQLCDDASDTSLIEYNEVPAKGVATHSRATPLYSMRKVWLASSQCWPCIDHVLMLTLNVNGPQFPELLRWWSIDINLLRQCFTVQTWPKHAHTHGSMGSTVNWCLIQMNSVSLTTDVNWSLIEWTGSFLANSDKTSFLDVINFPWITDWWR